MDEKVVGTVGEPRRYRTQNHERFLILMVKTAPKFVTSDPPDQDKLAVVLALAEEQVRLQLRADGLETELKTTYARFQDIAHKQLPDAMDAAGTDHIGLPDLGYDVKLKPWYDGSLPKREDGERRQQAISWLIDNEHGDLIKTTVTVSFGRHEHNLAISTFESIKNYLAEQGLPNIVALSEDVHHMTFKAFLREQTEAGVVLPLDTLNAVVGRVAKIEERKDK